MQQFVWPSWRRRIPESVWQAAGYADLMARADVEDFSPEPARLEIAELDKRISNPRAYTVFPTIDETGRVETVPSPAEQHASWKIRREVLADCLEFAARMRRAPTWEEAAGPHIDLGRAMADSTHEVLVAVGRWLNTIKLPVEGDAVEALHTLFAASRNDLIEQAAESTGYSAHQIRYRIRRSPRQEIKGGRAAKGKGLKPLIAFLLRVGR